MKTNKPYVIEKKKLDDISGGAPDSLILTVPDPIRNGSSLPVIDVPGGMILDPDCILPRIPVLRPDLSTDGWNTGLPGNRNTLSIVV